MKTIPQICLRVLLPAVLMGTTTTASLSAQAADPLRRSLKRIQANIQRVQRELRKIEEELEKVRAALAETSLSRTQARQRRAASRRPAATPGKARARQRAARGAQRRARRATAGQRAGQGARQGAQPRNQPRVRQRAERLRKVQERRLRSRSSLRRQLQQSRRREAVEPRPEVEKRRRRIVEGIRELPRGRFGGLRRFGFPPLAWYLLGFGPGSPTTVLPRSRITVRSLPAYGGASILVIPELGAGGKQAKSKKTKQPGLLRKKRSYL